MSSDRQADVFVSPSSVHPLSLSEFNNNSPLKTAGSDVIQSNGAVPELKVVRTGDKWFALDGAQLDFYRRLEADGRCSEVKVIAVPPSSLPADVQTLLLSAPGDTDGPLANNHNDGENSDDDDTDTNSSCLTDSEFDWSGDEPVSSDDDSSGSDD